jgi:chromosome segregation ATPase
MKLRRLRIEHFKRFREPLTIDGLVDGLNLFAAPNESGKSTVAEAICAAFFERHRSGSVEHLRPWGDASATPTVELEFDIEGRRHRLTKAFLGRKRCDLVIDGQRALDGVAAEDHLAKLLGFKFPGKGASGPEHMGIPGLLWVRQSTAHQLADAVSHASDQLRQILGESFGELASSGGDALLREVEAARNELLTPSKGEPRGAYEAARKRSGELAEVREQLDRDILSYRASVDRLAALRRDHLREEHEQPWGEIQRQLEVAQARLEAAQGLETQQTQALATLQQWSAQVASLRSQLEAFARDETAVTTRLQAVQTATQLEIAAQSEFAAWERRYRDAVTADAQARAQLERVRAQSQRTELAKSKSDLDADVHALSDALTRAREERSRVLALQSEAQALAIAPADLKALRRLSESLRDVCVRLDAVATSIEFDLVDGASLCIDGDTIAGQARRTVVNRTQIEIEGIGRVVIAPGGENLDQLAASRSALSAELDALLRQLGVAGVAEAEQRAQQAEQRARDAKATQKVLDALAPKGVDTLEAELTARTARLSEVRTAIAALPVATDGDTLLPPRATAQTESERAASALESAAHALNQARVTVARAQSDLAAARQELAAAETTLHDARRAERVTSARQSLSDALMQEAAARQRVEVIAAELNSVNLALLRQDVERLARSAQQLEADHKRRHDDITRLEVELGTKGALGLEEQRAEVERECGAASRRADELKRRADALDYLLRLLREKRSALARRLREPLQKHLDRYLQILFPGARIEVAEDLSPGVITRTGPRGEESGEFEDLSLGTREQMGIVARLAYADLLKESGKPTLLILDDALVNSDEARLGQMKRVLYDAAARHQVLIFTCHPAAWRDLGVVARGIGS